MQYRTKKAKLHFVKKGANGLFRASRAAMAEGLREGMAKADFSARLVWLPNAIKHIAFIFCSIRARKKTLLASLEALNG